LASRSLGGALIYISTPVN